MGLDGTIDPAVLDKMSERIQQRFIADQLGQADVEVTFGSYVVGW